MAFMAFVIAIVCFVLGGFAGIVCLMWITAGMSGSEAGRFVTAISISGVAAIVLIVFGGWLLFRFSGPWIP